MDKREVKQFLEDRSLKPIKKLGQNFLVNPGLAQAIVRSIQNHPPPFVEVGPGLGALTRHFNRKDIFLIEKDKKLAEYWSQEGWTVFCEDALKFKWSQLPKRFTLFGNLPYEIASSLIIQFSIDQKQASKMVFLIQKEAAERVKALPHSKHYGLLSVIAQSFWFVSTLFSIQKSDFYPIPQVEGRFLEFRAKKFNTSISPPLFLQFVKKCFQFKRKMLFKQLNISNAKETLESLNLWPNCRAENLTPKNFLQLYMKIKKEGNYTHNFENLS